MPLITKALEGFGTSDDCNLLSGLRNLFVARRQLIDWPTMMADPTKYDAENGVVLEYVYLPGGEHVEIEFDRESAVFGAEYTLDNSFYEFLIPMIFEGQSLAKSNRIRNLVANCDLTLHAVYASGIERVAGIEVVGQDGSEVFDRPFQRFRVQRHNDTSGTPSGDKGRDEIDIAGRQQHSALYARVGVGALRDSVRPQANVAFTDDDGENTDVLVDENNQGTALSPE
jgi:hypothetical protein